jgi:hypothetical protein
MMTVVQTIRTAAVAAGMAAAAVLALSPQAEAKSGQNRLVVVDGDRGRVVYDDGRNDGACIFRRVFVGYDWYGYPRFRKVYRCF